MRVVADLGDEDDAQVTVEGDRPDKGLNAADPRGKPPWWLISTSGRFARFGAWLWLLFAGLAIVQLVIADDPVVRWIAVGQILIGLGLSASYFVSLRYTGRAEERQPGQR